MGHDADYEFFSLPDYAIIKDDFKEIVNKFSKLYKTKERKVSK